MNSHVAKESNVLASILMAQGPDDCVTKLVCYSRIRGACYCKTLQPWGEYDCSRGVERAQLKKRLKWRRRRRRRRERAETSPND